MIAAMTVRGRNHSLTERVVSGCYPDFPLAPGSLRDFEESVRTGSAPEGFRRCWPPAGSRPIDRLEPVPSPRIPARLGAMQGLALNVPGSRMTSQSQLHARDIACRCAVTPPFNRHSPPARGAGVDRCCTDPIGGMSTPEGSCLRKIPD